MTRSKTIQADFSWAGRNFQTRFLAQLMSVQNLLLIAPRQHGKSEVAIRVLITCALSDKTRSTHVYMTPFVSQARKVIWDRLKHALDPIRKHCVVREADLIITLPNGARILLAGGDNEGYRGTSARTLIIDEADNFDEDILNDRKAGRVFKEDCEYDNVDCVRFITKYNKNNKFFMIKTVNYWPK
jgi:hypothetical protein